MLFRFLHQLFQVRNGTFRNQVGGSWRADKNFNGRYSFPIDRWDEPLRDDAAHVQRQVLEQLWVALFWKEVDDSVHGLVGAVGVQGGQTKVTSFSERQGMLHRFTMTYFAN